MLQRRSGKIILLAGAGADGARPQFAAYAASKAALVRFAECLAEEVRDYNIQVNCVNPGPTYTAMTDEILRARDVVNEQEFREAARVRTTGGTAHEQQVALFRFLASDRSNHLSGKLLHITDNLRKLEHGSANPDQFTLRRVMKV
jgi:Short-chain dehydrogenases of various substrate specificities